MIDSKLLNQLYPDKEKNYTKILLEFPTAIAPVVTQSDAEQGYLTRYFVRAANDISLVVEIDKKQFESLKKNPRFVTTSIKWKIVGKKETEYRPSGVPVYGTMDSNRQIVANADLTFGGLRTYIQDYGQFWVAERL